MGVGKVVPWWNPTPGALSPLCNRLLSYGIIKHIHCSPRSRARTHGPSLRDPRSCIGGQCGTAAGAEQSQPHRHAHCTVVRSDPLSVTASGACQAAAHSACHCPHPRQAQPSLLPMAHHLRRMSARHLHRPSTSRRYRCSTLHWFLLLVLLRQRQCRPSRAAPLKRPQPRSTAPNRRLVHLLPLQREWRRVRSTGTCMRQKKRRGQGETVDPPHLQRQVKVRFIVPCGIPSDVAVGSKVA